MTCPRCTVLTEALNELLADPWSSRAQDYSQSVLHDCAPPGPKFVAVHHSKTVMRAAQFIATACSHTMALRIANALNRYKPNERGS